MLGTDVTKERKISKFCMYNFIYTIYMCTCHCISVLELLSDIELGLG